MVKVDHSRSSTSWGEDTLAPLGHRLEVRAASGGDRDPGYLPQVGRTGVITPTPILEPVEVSGVMVSRATLHNWEEMERKDIRMGDTVVVERAGDVIPAVVQVLTEQRRRDGALLPIPASCPECGVARSCKIPDEVAVRCLGLACPAQLRESMNHFASRHAMDIDGLGADSSNSCFASSWCTT